jgi:putative transcriptional regulator
MDSLAGSFLVATNQMPDPSFGEKIIFICSHNATEGAMGLVINHPIEGITFEEIFASMKIEVFGRNFPQVFSGGPVDPDSAFFLHSSEYIPEKCIKISQGLCLSRDPHVLRDIAINKGPGDYRLMLGYSGWAPGQLENELIQDGWLILPASPEDIFVGHPEFMWKKITAKHGIDIRLFGEISGTA